MFLTGPPPAVSDVNFDAVNNYTLFINWNTLGSCIEYFNVTIISNNTYYDFTATYNPIIGTNYSFIVIPIDSIGREGPPSSLPQYEWNRED